MWFRCATQFVENQHDLRAVFTRETLGKFRDNALVADFFQATISRPAYIEIGIVDAAEDQIQTVGRVNFGEVLNHHTTGGRVS